jgi:NTP pyrophosphatase (non-canonical NTP hydrolase)
VSEKYSGQSEIADLQLQVSQFERERGFDSESAMVKCLLLGEEIGELFKAVRYSSGLGVDQNSTGRAVGEELADVFIFLLALANRFHLELGGEVSRKLDINKHRAWNRSI